MVCTDCEKKKEFMDRGVACADPYKSGSREDKMSGVGGSGRKIGNMLLTTKGKAGLANPYDKKCELCKQKLHDGGLYCQDCSYAKGICRLCGKQVLSAREFYKSFYSAENEKKFAPKRKTEEAQPGATSDGEEGEEPSFDPKVAPAETSEPVKKKVKKVKKADGSDSAKYKALEQQAAMKKAQEDSAAAVADFVKDEASGYMYNAKTQQYYDPASQMYYTYQNSAWYFYNATKGTYEPCSTMAAKADPGPPPAAAKPQTPAEIAAEIASHAGSGSMPLEQARARAKPAMSGLRTGA